MYKVSLWNTRRTRPHSLLTLFLIFTKSPFLWSLYVSCLLKTYRFPFCVIIPQRKTQAGFELSLCRLCVTVWLHFCRPLSTNLACNSSISLQISKCHIDTWESEKPSTLKTKAQLGTQWRIISSSSTCCTHNYVNVSGFKAPPFPADSLISMLYIAALTDVGWAASLLDLLNVYPLHLLRHHFQQLHNATKLLLYHCHSNTILKSDWLLTQGHVSFIDFHTRQEEVVTCHPIFSFPWFASNTVPRCTKQVLHNHY